MACDPTYVPYGARVYQAQGMVAVQANCDMSEAFALMEDTARATDVTLDEIADEVVERRVRFDRPTR